VSVNVTFITLADCEAVHGDDDVSVNEPGCGTAELSASAKLDVFIAHATVSALTDAPGITATCTDPVRGFTVTETLSASRPGSCDTTALTS
jgi:hypothetical protein